MGGLRYANIGLAVGVAILVSGSILFRNAGEGALKAVALVGFISAFVVFHTLDEWAKRHGSD
jgi:hypothetical protein